MNFVLYLLSVLFPPFGIIGGAIYAHTSDGPRRETGKVMILCGLVSTAVAVLMYSLR